MTTALDVLLIENHPGAGSADAEQLVAAGHRIHRCFPDGKGSLGLRDGYLCVGATTGSCPLDGGIDVALIVRRPPAARLAASEGGVGCALRDGVPVVEDGVGMVDDPLELRLAGRARNDVVVACEAAARQPFDAVRRGFEARVARVLEANNVHPGTVSCMFEPRGSRLLVSLSGPAISDAFEQALAVRMLDAVHAAGRAFDRIDVSYRPDCS